MNDATATLTASVVWAPATFNWIRIPILDRLLASPEPDIASTPRERVQAGARLLDREVPGWWKAVRIDRIDLNSETDCILGQVFGSFDEGFDRLGFVEDEHEDEYEDYEHGFLSWTAASENIALATRWRAEIRKRTRDHRKALRRAW